ncbi:hypothetical protein MJ579_15060 [Klebsiella pneumoniae]|nr:hypothetical protein MJ579_15060 [Klebsiella pneumoniae]
MFVGWLTSPRCGDAPQGRDPADDFQADKASERTGNLLERGLEGQLRAAGGYFTTGAMTTPGGRGSGRPRAERRPASCSSRMPPARSAAFIISASEGGNQYLRISPLARAL